MYPSLAIFILAVIPSIYKGRHKNACDVVPKDQYIEEGSDIEIVCQTSCVRGKVFWTLNNTPMDENLSNTINSSHTVLSLRNFTHHRATLQCHSAATLEVLGGTTLRTYSKPSKVSCILDYIDQSAEVSPERFTCSWEHKVHPSSEISYTVLGAYWLHPSRTEICSSRVTTCAVDYTNISDKIPLLGNSTITVRAKSALWEAYSDPYIVYPYRILKIIRPRLDVTDDLLVKWKRSFTSKKSHCQVKYSKAVDEGTPEAVNEITPEWVINKTLDPGEKGNVTVEKVESCTTYKVAVRCALDGAPWSDWSHETTVLTKLKKSDVKLRLWRNVAEPDQNGVRKVHAMWTAIPSTCRGTFTYTVKPIPGITGVNFTHTSCGNSTCDVDVNQDAHRINLTVFHNEALLVEDSVYVPAIGQSLPQVTDIQTSTLEGVILVSWKAPVRPVSGYVIDYTHDGNQYNWKESKYTNATLFDLLDKRPYNITVTPLIDGNETGHGTQALQICSRVGDPGNVTIINVQAYDKSAFVSWIVKSQEACSGIVVNQTVVYSTPRGSQLNVTVDGTKRSISLKDLTPDTQYGISVKATALTGTTQSSQRLFQTKTYDPRLYTALLVCGIIAMVLVLSLGLCIAIQWKKFQEKPVPNPGLSSVALWPSASHEEGTCPFRPFINPPESPYDRVYTEEPWRTPTPPLPTGCNGNPASDQTEQCADADVVPAPDVQNEDPVEAAETQHPSSPGESTALLPSDNGQLSPYRCQSPVETPTPRTSKQCQRVPVKQQQKTAPVTLYVTLDMFEQGQGQVRGMETKP